MESRPFIKLFAICSGKYVYDVGTNTILKVSDKVYSMLQYMCKYGYEKFVEKYPPGTKERDEISILMEQGVCGFKRPLRSKHLYTDIVEDILNKRLSTVVLQITQICNFRCRYCPYSGEGFLNRTHTNKTMRFEVAKKIIDFILLHGKFSDVLDVGFYGGEPLLHYDLIKNIILYIKEEACGKEIFLSMTTNGSILTDDMLLFFKENNVMLTISLDGPDSVHNKNRRFVLNGEGTFGEVYNNLKNIVENHADYIKNISINAVWDTEEEYQEIVKFFQEDKVLSCFLYSITTVDNSKSSVPFNMVEANYTEQAIYETLNYLDALGLISNGMSARDERVLNFVEDFEKLYTPQCGMPDECQHSGPCLPGYMRLFSDINGNFFPCEKVSEKSDICKIGDVDTGFDIEKIKKLLNLGKITEAECINCWAMKFCTCCLNSIDNLENLSREMKLYHCSEVKKTAIDTISNYLLFKEWSKILTSEK